MKKFYLSILLSSIFLLNIILASAQCNITKKILEKNVGGHTNFDQAESVTDKENNLYIAATFRSDPNLSVPHERLDLGNGVFVPWTPWSIIIIKYNKNLELQWYRTIVEPKYWGREPLLTIDSSGCIYIGRMAKDTVYTEGVNFFLNDGGYLFKISPLGKVIWHKTIDKKDPFPMGYGTNQLCDIHISRNSNVFILAKSCADKATFDNIILQDPTPNNRVADHIPTLAKYDSSGKILWAKLLGVNKATDTVCINRYNSLQICTDENENIYITGVLKGRPDLKFGNLLLKKDKIYPYDIPSWFIVKLDKNGDGIWGKVYSDTCYQYFQNINFKYDWKGSLYYEFDYQGVAKIDNMIFKSTYASYGLKWQSGILKLDTAGNFLKCKDFSQKVQYKGSNYIGRDFKIDGQGNLYMCGENLRQICFDTFCSPYTDTLYTQSYAVKLNPDLNVIWAIFENKYRWTDVFQSLTFDDSAIITLLQRQVSYFDTTTPLPLSNGSMINIMQYRNNFSVLPYSWDNNKCYYDQTGYIGLKILEGKRPYSVNWLGGLGSDTVLNNLKLGDYYAVVTDARGCKDTVKATIYTKSSKILTKAEIVDDMKNTRSGEIRLTVTGGVPPYKFKWDDPFHQTTKDVFNLWGGTYNCKITDNFGCITDTFFTVLKPVGIEPPNIGSKINYYPNPLRGNELYLELSTCTSPFTVMIYNSVGELIYQKKFECQPGSEYKLSLPEMKKGIYHLNVVSDSTSFTRNVVVEN